MSDEGNSIDNLSARVRILTACRNELVAKIARDVRAMRATVHAKVAEGAEDASVAAEDQGKQGNKKNAATLAARLDGYSTAQLVDFLAALKVHVVRLDPNNFFHILEDSREHRQILSRVDHHERDHSLTGDMFACGGRLKSSRPKKAPQLNKGWYVLMPRGKAEYQVRVLQRVFGADCAVTPRDPALLKSLTRGTLLLYLKSLKDFGKEGLTDIDDLWEVISGPLDGRPVTWQRFRDIFTALPGTCERTRLHQMDMKDIMSQSLSQFRVVNELFAEKFLNPIYADPLAAGKQKARLAELRAELQKATASVMELKEATAQRVASAVTNSELPDADRATISVWHDKVDVVRKAFEDVEVGQFGMYTAAKHDLDHLKRSAAPPDEISKAEEGMRRAAVTAKRVLGVCGADPVPGSSSEQVRALLDHALTTLKSKLTVFKATSSVALGKGGNTASELKESSIDICVKELGLITKRLQIAEEELKGGVSCRLRSHGKIRYHFSKGKKDSTSRLQFEGVFARDDEQIHDDDDYETEVIKVAHFLPNTFSHSQNWIYISDHEMGQNKFSKSLMPGLYCFILRSSEDSDALATLGVAAKQDVSLMHASVRNREVSNAEYYRAKWGAFLYFEVRPGGSGFHDARLLTPKASGDSAGGEDWQSFAAWHDSHSQYGRFHLNHGLNGDAAGGDAAGSDVPAAGAQAGAQNDTESDSDSDEDDGEEANKIGADAKWSYKEDDTGIHLRGNFAKERSPRELFGLTSRSVVGHRMSFHLNMGVPAWNGMAGKWICYTRI
jgi:hypothetical protein